MNIVGLILSLSVISGQLIRISIHTFPTVGAVSLLDIVVIIFCIFGLLKSKFRLRKPPKFITAAVIFILVTVISLIFTPLHLQFTEIGISLFYIIRFSLYILFAWLIYSGIFSNLTKQISNTLMYSGIGLAILGLLQFIFLPDLSFLTKLGWDPHYFRTVSTFLDPNFAGAYFVLTLALLMSLRGSLAGWRSILFLILVYSALLTTFSRSSYLMFLTAGLSLSFLEKSKILFFKTIFLFLILLLGFQIYTQAVAKPRNIERGKSASSRLNTWQQGWQLFSIHPFLGTGFNAYRFGIREYNLGDEKFLQSHGSSSNDSSLLFVAATTGVIGLISYLYFLYCLISTNYLNNQKYLLPAVFGLLFHSIFANSLFFSPILLWLLLISAVPKR